MAKAKKVSFNQETAKSTERHNDRSMYKWGYSERSNNIHWDKYGCGSSFEAEARFYEDTFKHTLEVQNDRAIAMRKRDRVMDMKAWHEKHPLKEAIVQLGDVDNNDTSREFAEGAAQVIGDAITAAGGTVVSIDLHDDERTIDEDGNEIVGTPHLHIRFAFVGENKDKNPVMDMKNVLLAHGIDRPDPDKPTSKTNNPAQTFLETTRTMLEDYADELELAHGNPRVNRKREKRSHSSVQQYKMQKRNEELERQANEAIATRDNALADANRVKQEQDERERELAEERQRLDLRASELSAGEEALARKAEALKRASDARERKLDERERKQDERESRQDERESELNALEDKLVKLKNFLEGVKRDVLGWVKWIKTANDEEERVARLREAAPKAEDVEKVVVRVDMSEYEDEQSEDELTF